MTLRSALYVGSVMHRRLHPRKHRFSYRAFWLLIDLDELDELSGSLGWFSYNRPNVFSLYDVDHGDGTSTVLRTQIKRQLAEAGLDLTGGRVRLLCMPRTLGYCFNPLSLFFCYHADGKLAAVVYQVHNTFRERHSYIIPVEKDSGTLHQRSRKVFYVSPFMDMDVQYAFRIAAPDERIVVGICAGSSAGAVLNAVLVGVRRNLTDRDLKRIFLQIPAVTIKVSIAIHWEALRLWAKRIRPRPRSAQPERPATVIPATLRSGD
jgi:uncharacterized protein